MEEQKEGRKEAERERGYFCTAGKFVQSLGFIKLLAKAMCQVCFAERVICRKKDGVYWRMNLEKES